MQYIVYSLIAIAVLGGGWFLLSPKSADAPEVNGSLEEVITETDETMAEHNEVMVGDDGTMMEDGTITEEDSVTESNPKAEGGATTVTIDLTAKNFEFSEKEIRVKKGDTVKVTLKSNNGFHDWVVDGLDAKTDRINTGETTSITFTADKTGTFEYYCSVGSHRELGMVGKLIVE
jgi:plastocyanin